jgi:photosystem II stability/assembly factor-like uncharacterized protein
VKISLLLPLLLIAGCATGPAPLVDYEAPPGPYSWTKLNTEAFRGKQDDIYFINPQVGWYVNGSGKIFKTTDGGATWTLKLHQPGTYFRTIAFLNEQRGFAGNIGTEYYPNVTDTTPLYETRDGGDTWKAVTTISGPTVKGLCAIDIVRAGGKTRITAAGRVGGPAFMIVSEDGGETWKSTDLSAVAGPILDVHFFDLKTGIICSGSDNKTENSNALILLTRDGGATWTKQYQSTRPFEITWKASFPTRNTGYVTIQNYNPDKSVTSRFVAKTTDGGVTWSETKLVDDFAVREFGVGFIDPTTGWVGTTTGGFETTDGGATWNRVELGKAVNKIRLLRTGAGFVGYAIGVEVHKLDRSAG